MLKNLLAALIICFITLSGMAQQPKYSRVKIWTGDTGLKKLSELGIETDHGEIRKNVWFVSDFSSGELLRISNAGYRYDILIDDVAEHYRTQAATGNSRIMTAADCDMAIPQYAQPVNFSLGSYAGYFTYQEMLDNLDSMASKYPNLITIKQALPGGTTHEGNQVYYVKISDNPVNDESEPEMLYTSVHHAREPGGMSQLIFYMWYLLENYTSDTEIAAIINNTEMFFVPCVNPDGYMFNELTDPSGGGMWRKNRRDNLDGSFGVDLNRNYGYNWGYDDDGSSPDPSGETYRGDVAFSEPETQLIRDFTNSRTFGIAVNYHTYGNLLIYPWGYEYSIYTPDSAVFATYGNLLTTYNGYTYGTADQTVGYITNGSSDDWMYGEQATKPKIFSMTPECGDEQFGFWPPSSEILPLCQNTMFQNLTAALLTGKYAIVEEKSPEWVNNGGGYLQFELQQLGLDTTGTYTITVTALTPNIVAVGNAFSQGNLSLLQTIQDSVSYALTSPMTHGDTISFLLSIDNGVYVRNDTIVKYFGPTTIPFASDCNTTSGWNSGQWGTSNVIYYSPSASITDSPLGDYDDNEFKICQITNPVNLTNAVKATLSFYARWATEPNFDYVQVQASDNGGTSWTSLCGNYTVPGSDFQAPGEPVYEGFQLGWIKEEMSLDEFTGGNVLIRFILVSDNWQEYDGFYFDDVTISTILPGTNGLEDTQEQMHVLLAPNPASGYAYVTLTSPEDGFIRIYDATGRLAMEQSAYRNSGSVKLNLENLGNGIYFVRFENGNTISSPVKLVVQ